MRNTILGCVVVLMAVISSGCSTVQTNELSSEEALSLNNKSLTISHRNNLPNFAAQTAANVQFGLIGLATAITNGNNMISENSVVDPAIEMANLLAEDLRDSYGMKLSKNNIVVESAKVVDLVNAYGDFDYILDVHTTGWGSIYYRSSWGRYQVRNGALARLIDSNNSEVLVEVRCFANSSYQDLSRAPTYEELQQGNRLQEELSKSVVNCVNLIRSEAQIAFTKQLVAEESGVIDVVSEPLVHGSVTLEDILESEDGLLLRELGREYYSKDSVDQSDLDLFAGKIWQVRLTGDAQVADAAAWFCKLLAKSKSARHYDLLSRVADTATSAKLRKYAKKGLADIPDNNVEQFMLEDPSTF